MPGAGPKHAGPANDKSGQGEYEKVDQIPGTEMAVNPTLHGAVHAVGCNTGGNGF